MEDNKDEFDTTQDSPDISACYEHSQKLDKLFSALSKAQAEMKPAAKNKFNKFYGSYYADLASCWEACREALSKNELSLIQPIIPDSKRAIVKTILGHSSGQFYACTCEIKLTKEDAHGLGSAITYARRYGLGAMTGICTDEDDDGNHAAGKTTNNEKHKKKDAPKTQEEPKRPLSVDEMLDEIASIDNNTHLFRWWNKHKDEISALSPQLRKKVLSAKDGRKAELSTEKEYNQGLAAIKDKIRPLLDKKYPNDTDGLETGTFMYDLFREDDKTSLDDLNYDECLALLDKLSAA